MESAGRPTTKKSVDIQVLRCLNPACRGLLAYEVDHDNVLYVDLAWTARTGDGCQYFPCPKCGAKNIIERWRTVAGVETHRVARWEP